MVWMTSYTILWINPQLFEAWILCYTQSLKPLFCGGWGGIVMIRYSKVHVGEHKKRRGRIISLRSIATVCGNNIQLCYVILTSGITYYRIISAYLNSTVYKELFFFCFLRIKNTIHAPITTPIVFKIKSSTSVCLPRQKSWVTSISRVNPAPADMVFLTVSSLLKQIGHTIPTGMNIVIFPIMFIFQPSYRSTRK